MKRRHFLALAGGGIVVAAGATLGVVASRSPDAALRPWAAAGTDYAEPRMKALSYAILSPNPHNRQPWLADLSQPGAITLFVDTDRMLPHTDPFNRQIAIGLGCFLETLRMAAAEDGYRAEMALFPEGSDEAGLDKRPVAHIKMIRDTEVKPDPLFAHVMARRSVKEPYDLGKPVSEQSLAALMGSALHGTRFETTAQQSDVAALRKLTADALMIELKTPHTYKESVDLMRIGKAEVEANPDGIDFSGPLFETLGALGMLNREGLLDPSSSIFQQGLDAVLANANSGMGYVWQITKTNSRADQIAAGQDWMRLHLAATREGLALQPMSQALQEFPEMKALYTKAHKKLAPEGGTLQMLARLGYADAPSQSPRWPLEAKLIKG